MKKIFFILILFFSSLTWSLPTGLVGYWSGDGNANDSSGNNNNGNLVNGAGFTAGQFGQAFDLRAGGSFVEIASASEIQLTGSYTMSMWINLSEFHGAGSSFKRPINKEANPQGYSLLFNNDGRLFGGSVSDGLVGTTTNSWDADRWYNVAFTFDGSNTRVFVDGVFESSIVGGSINATGAPLRFGVSSFLVQKMFGLMDEVAFFDRALSLSEIQVVQNQGVLALAIPEPRVFVLLLTGIFFFWRKRLYLSRH